MKETKAFKGTIDGISEVKETAKEGLFRFAVKKGEDWYGFSESSKVCLAEHEEAQKARDEGYTVEFDYTDDGRWLNITDVKSWNVETEGPAQKPPEAGGEKEPEATDQDHEDKVYEALKQEKHNKQIAQGVEGYEISVAVFEKCTGKKVVWDKMTEAEKTGLMAWATSYKIDVAKGR